jgi:hypothetical protein
MLKRHVKQIVMVALTAVAVGVCGAMGSIASAQEIQRADVGQRVLPLADDMSKVVVLKGQAEGTSRRDALKRVMGGREQNIPSAPSAMSMDEKLGVLKSAGLKTLSETSTPRHTSRLLRDNPMLPIKVNWDLDYRLWWTRIKLHTIWFSLTAKCDAGNCVRKRPL